MVLHLGTDLMLASSIGAVARERGIAFRSLTSADRLLSALAGPTEVTLAIVNLQLPNLDIEGLGKSLQELPEPAVPVIWAAQHVFEDLLARAAATGVGQVMTRGQLVNRLPLLIAPPNS